MATFKGQLVLALMLNVGLKMLTFTLSTLLTRKLLPYQNGVYFTYNVYNDAILFVAREATRNVASRLSILEEKDDGDDKQPVSETSGSSFQTEKITSNQSPNNLAKKVDVNAVRRMISVALCSVPLAVAGTIVLEVSGVCFGRASIFPSMLRHARLSQQQQPYLSAPPLTPSGVTGSLKSTLDNLPLLLLPYLPEVTVIGCTILMALVEPCIVVVQSLNLFRVVVLAECATLTVRLVTVLTVVCASQRRGAEAFQADGEPLNENGLRTLWEARMVLAFGQVAYAITHVVYYAVVLSGLPLAQWLGASAELQHVRAACIEERATELQTSSDARHSASADVMQKHSRPPQSTYSKMYEAFVFPWCFYVALDAADECRRQAALLLTFLRESLLRLVLSEGESFALASFGSEAARGYYQLIYSLGSLVARLLFRVWENACFVKWSREASLGHWHAAVQLLKFMLRLSFYVGFSFTLLGPPLTRTFLKTMYTSRWATPQVTEALQLCFYGMPLMAWNGLLEAFLRAVASPAVLQRLQRWMVGETIVYIAACYITLISFVKEDEKGDSVSVLVLLNTLNMLWRCGASLYLLVSSSNAVAAVATMPAVRASSAAGYVSTERTKRASEIATKPSSQLHCGNNDATADETQSVVQLHEFVRLLPPQILIFLSALFVASRAMAASLLTAASVGVAYGVVILMFDAEMRRFLIAPVWKPLRGLLLHCYRYCGHRAPLKDVTSTTMVAEEK